MTFLLVIVLVVFTLVSLLGCLMNFPGEPLLDPPGFADKKGDPHLNSIMFIIHASIYSNK